MEKKVSVASRVPKVSPCDGKTAHESEVAVLRHSRHDGAPLAWWMRKSSLVRMRMHLRALMGISLKLRASCSTTLFSSPTNGFFSPAP
jgi:hypothetical protein